MCQNQVPAIDGGIVSVFFYDSSQLLHFNFENKFTANLALAIN